MRIWLVNHYAIPPTRAGGTRHFSLARHLVRQGHQVTVVAATHGLPISGGEAPPTPGEETIEGVAFRWIEAPPYAGNSLGRLKNMLGFAKNFRAWASTVPTDQRPQAIVGSSPHLFAADAAARVAAAWKIPFAAEIRDIWPESLTDLGVPKLHPFVLWMAALERRVYARASGIVTLLPASVPYFERFGIRPTRIAVIPNGIDLSSVPEVAPAPQTDPFTLVYAGAHGVANGLDLVLDAAKLLAQDPVRFVLMGDGPERARLVQRADQEGLSNVELRGPVPKQEVHRALEAAHAGMLILTKMDVFRYGISPNKLFDYLAVRRPAILSVDADVSHLLATGAVLQTPAGDPAAFATAVRKLAATPPEQRHQMGCAGRDYVAEHHDFASQARKLADFLSSL